MPGSACLFAPRRTSTAIAFEFPRYVDQADREIYPALPDGEVGSALLMRIVSTGRAYLGALDGAPLRTGEPRAVTLVWKTLANGDQVLRWHEELEVLLGAEPPLYVDVQGELVGGVELACEVELAREMARLGSVPPERVDEVNKRIESASAGIAALEGMTKDAIDSFAGLESTTPGTAGSVAGPEGTTPDTVGNSPGLKAMTPATVGRFPRLHAFTPVTDSLRSIAPRLVLSNEKQALLKFINKDKPENKKRKNESNTEVRIIA